MNKIHLIALILLYPFIENKLIAQNTLPKDLNEAIEYFQNSWTKENINTFKKLPEQKAVSEQHFGTGLWIRNNWIRGDRNPPLIKYFNSLGAFNPDNISSIILLSFHRKLNNKKLDVEKQVAEYKAYWDKIDECDNKLKKVAVDNYNKYKIGSKITIYMYVDTSSKQRNAVTLMCPKPDWKFNPQKDLKMNCTVTEKYNINSESNVFFKIRIDRMNYINTRIYMNEVKVGDIIDLSLSAIRIE